METVTPDSTRYWLDEIREFGADAVVEVAEEFAAVGSVTDLQNNVLSEVGDRLARAVRRRMLLATLRATKWNLSHCAERLRMADASAVRKEVTRLGLSAEYEAARQAGAVAPGGHKTRAPDEKPAPKDPT